MISPQCRTVKVCTILLLAIIAANRSVSAFSPGANNDVGAFISPHGMTMSSSSSCRRNTNELLHSPSQKNSNNIQFTESSNEPASKLIIPPRKMSLDRRTTLSHIALATVTGLTTIAQPAFSAETSSIVTPQSILEARSIENALSPPPYGMEETDIRYPSYFQGTWNAVSKTANVYAPCGYELFSGGKAAYDNTIQKEVAEGETLQYRARFVRGDDSLNGGGEKGGGVYIAADREYNAKEIAKAAMGSYSVVDVSVATPNRFSCVLAPPGGISGEMNNLIAVDILAIARKSEPISPTKFVCSEVVRQIVSPARSRTGASSPKLVKEIETISIYDVGNVVDVDSITQIPCKQRTATYLVPSQTDPVAFKMWQMSQGRPVDVRYYDVIYTRAV